MKTAIQLARIVVIMMASAFALQGMSFAARPENLLKPPTVKKLTVTRSSHAGMDLSGFQLQGISTGVAFGPTSLRRTEDGGGSWKDITPPFVSACGHIGLARFADLENGWVFYSPDASQEISTEVWRTSDGGRNWRKAEKTLPVTGDSLSASFLDGQLGWVLTRLPSSSNFSYSRLFQTDDGGQSWLEFPRPPAAGQIKFVSPTDGWILGGPSGNELFVTRDGGMHWSIQNLPIDTDGASSVEVTLPEHSRAGWMVFGAAVWKQDGSGYIYSIESSIHEGAAKVLSILSVEAGEEAGARLVSANKDVIILAGQAIIKGSHAPSETDGANSPQMLVETDGVIGRVEIFGSRMWGLIRESGCRSFKVDCYQYSALGSYHLDLGEYLDITPRLEEASISGTGAQALLLRPTPAAVLQSTKAGFDKCAVASVTNMQTWMSSSPYYDANIYIGGVNRSCSQSLLNSSWVSQVLAQNWRLIPTWVGPQSPSTTCSTCSRFSTNSSTARQQGIDEANLAANAVSSLGLAAPSIIYFDLEMYSTQTSAETQFVDGWVAQLHQMGYDAGLYVHYTNVASFTSLTNPLDGVWIARWYYGANGSPAPPSTIPSPNSIPGVSDSIFVNKRIWQYYGGATETWGGVTFNIDIDSANGLVAVGGGSTYTIGVSAAPSAGGTVSGGGTFAAGSSRTVTASANSGYAFANWMENGGVVSVSTSYTFTLNSNRNLVANFTAVNYTIGVSASPSAGGTVSGGGTFSAGSSRTVTASANSGYIFANWMENGGVVSVSTSYTFTLNSNRNLVANFTAVNYTIGVSASPSAGGTVSGGGTFASGSSRTVTASANSGYTFANWTENGGVVNSSTSYTFTLNSNRNLVANFTSPNYTLTVSASPSSGGTVSGGGTFAAGTSRTVTASANSGYTFVNWTENGNVVSSSFSYSFVLNAARALVANFSAATPAAPSGMSATALSSSSIKVSWVDNSNNETEFIVFRWNGSSWTKIATLGANVTSYTDTGLQPSTTYVHTVCSQNSVGAGCAAIYSSATTLTAGSTPPAAPSGMSATALSSSSIKVSWVDNSNNETEFIVFRWNGSGWTRIATLGANVTSYTDTGLQPSTTYVHTVCSQNSVGAGCAAIYSSATTLTTGSTPPAAPSGMNATTLSSSSIYVSWVDNSNNETEFLVFRWNGSGWTRIATLGANVTSYTDTGLQPSTTYVHTVCSQNSVGAGCAAIYSSATTLTTGSTPPAAPSGMNATALSSSSINVSWVDNSNNEMEFIVFRWNGAGWTQIATVGANVTSYTDTGLQPSTTYFHTVCSQNGVGAGCAAIYSSATTLTNSTPPAAPSGMSAYALSSSSIRVSWVDNSNNETEFIVFRWNGAGWTQIATVGANTASYMDTGLQPSTTYFHTVCSQNSVGANCAATYSTATTF
jgi:Domain of unknown function (DUF1906)/Divergent InlB B-repeat domain/Fibronectin type III domain